MKNILLYYPISSHFLNSYSTSGLIGKKGGLPKKKKKQPKYNGTLSVGLLCVKQSYISITQHDPSIVVHHKTSITFNQKPYKDATSA